MYVRVFSQGHGTDGNIFWGFLKFKIVWGSPAIPDFWGKQWMLGSSLHIKKT